MLWIVRDSQRTGHAGLQRLRHIARFTPVYLGRLKYFQVFRSEDAAITVEAGVVQVQLHTHCTQLHWSCTEIALRRGATVL